MLLLGMPASEARHVSAIQAWPTPTPTSFTPRIFWVAEGLVIVNASNFEAKVPTLGAAGAGSTVCRLYFWRHCGSPPHQLSLLLFILNSCPGQQRTAAVSVLSHASQQAGHLWKENFYRPFFPGSKPSLGFGSQMHKLQGEGHRTRRQELISETMVNIIGKQEA